MKALFVRDIMSSPDITHTPTVRLPAIKHLMHQNSIRRLPVVDGNRIVGIVSLGDVRNAFPSDATMLSIYELSYLLDKVSAADIMRTDVVAVEPDAPLTEAAQLMLQHKISGLPVVENGQLVGILTESDILRAIVDGFVPLATAVVLEQRPLKAAQPIV